MICQTFRNAENRGEAEVFSIPKSLKYYVTVIPRSGSMFGITWLLGPTSCLKIAVNDLGHIYSDQQVSGTHFCTKIRPIGPSDQKL